MIQDSRGSLVSKPFTRREFVSGAVTVAGGVALFSLPSRAFASPVAAFADSLGRPFEFSGPITSVVPLGVYAQTLMETLYPDALASLAKEVSADSGDFAEAGLASIVDLPETGTPDANYGKSADSEQVAALSPDLVLQAGIPHEGIAGELEQIQSESGVPCVFLDISFGKLQEAYRTLGRLLGCERRAEELACYIDNAQGRAAGGMGDIESGIRVFYGPRVAGKMVTDIVAVQTAAISALGLTPVAGPYDFAEGTVDFAALVEEGPDFVLLDDTTLPSALSSCEGEAYEAWRDVGAIEEGRFAVAPALMHSILGSPVFVQSIGMLWISYAVASYCFGYAMASEMVTFYELFYGLKYGEAFMSQLLGMEAENE